MSGAKNCPETPRQKMISMMYLVLTAMLALNVSADILKGFTMVNESLLTTIESTDQRNAALMKGLVELDSRNHDKIGPWLIKAQQTQAKSEEFYDYIKNFKYEMIRIADGRKVPKETIDTYEIESKDNTEAASNYGLTQGKGIELKNKIDEYREYVKGVFKENGKDKDDDYDRLFNTKTSRSGTDKAQPIKWETQNFESMPLAAAVTMLTKLQSDVKNTESELIQFLRNSTDAKDFRVNEIRAVVIPESKTVVAGTSYKAQIILAARDTTLHPDIVVNGAKLTDEAGFLTLGAASVGTHKLQGTLKFIDPISNEPREYIIDDSYSVTPPSATVANIDMNVVYMGYSNRMSISAPGFTTDKLTVTATNASIEKSGDNYICRPKSYDGVVINVSANVEGKQVSMGSQKFRVRALPNPTIFLSFKASNGDAVLWNPEIPSSAKLTRAALATAEVVAEYADGLLQASFKVNSFIMKISDGRGGFAPSNSNGNQFTDAQKNNFRTIKTGTVFFLSDIKVTGAKTATLGFPVVSIP
ncbi:MAG: gliding motility protein GldM [Prevotellaceae bacterium]|jgi:gliding motility-associated protein GldM|nr:gliding motility protein GldM [Prevotellaceae bacterium]